MTLRAIWNFNHLPAGTTSGASRLNLNSYGLTFLASGYGGVSTKAVVMPDGSLDVFLGSASSQSTMIALLTVPSSMITDGTSPKSYFGFKVNEVPATSSNTINLQLSINNLTVITREDPVLPEKGSVFYLEIGLDRIKKEITIYVDSVLVKTMTDANAAAIVSAYKNESPLKWGYHGFFTFGRADNFNFSNAYFADEVIGETTSARRGPTIVSPLLITSTVGEGWVSSDNKTLLEDLNTAYSDLASLTAPVIRSPNPVSELNIGITSSLSPTAVISAVQFLFDAQRNGGSVTIPKVVLKNAGSVQVLSPFAFTSDAIAYGLQTNISTTSPDGSAWNLTKLQQTTLGLSVA
jgi:hypothetical protein